MSFDAPNSYPLPPLPPGESKPAKTGNWFMRHKVASGSIGAFLGVMVIAGIAGGGSDREVVTTQASSLGSDVSTPAVDQEAIDKAVADALAKQAATTTASPAATPNESNSVAAPADDATADADRISFVAPNFVGMNLQDAQDRVQTYGIFFSRSHDLNGSRMQILDSNWKVCSQNIKAGTRITGSASEYEGKFDFGVVKIPEACP